MNHKSIDIAEDILRSENIPFERITDQSVVMKVRKGNCHPRDHLIRPSGSEKYFHNFYEVVEWINERGMRLC